jgi:hypothetical protein
MKRLLTHACTMAALLLAWPGAHATDAVFTGHCDGSAGVDLGQGQYAIADDDSPNLFIMSREGEAKGELGLAEALETTKTKKSGKRSTKETDTEGAARIGQRIYWIASHGLKGGNDKEKAEVDPYRLRFFATDIVAGAKGAALKLAKPYRNDLKAALLGHEAFKALSVSEGKGPEAPDGFNIEGLAEGPNGSLLIGFRNPIPGKLALVAQLDNPEQVIDKGKGSASTAADLADYQWGSLFRLDLDGRGIRSIEKVGQEWLIMAGPFDGKAAKPDQPTFALYRWAGTAQSKPVFLQGFSEPGFRPEGMFLDASAKELVLLSDNGDDTVHGKRCKDHDDEPSKREFKVRFLKWPLQSVK